MRVLVDARSLLPLSADVGPTGVGRWTDRVLRATAVQRPDWEIALFLLHQDAGLDPSEYGSNVSFEAIRLPERLSRRFHFLRAFPRIERWLGPADAVLAPAFVTWPARTPTIPVIHDLAHVHHPQFVSQRNAIFLRRMVPRSLATAPRAITVTAAMADEIALHYRYDRERIDVVPNAADDREMHADPGNLDVPDRFILFVGTMEPRKNLIGALRAYSLLGRDAETPPLIIVGGRGWRDEAIEAELRKTDPTKVRWLGYIDEVVLRSLYRRATLLLFPSFYEGFGLPVIEAMAAGCPVVTSKAGGTGEVAGDAAEFVDPSDPASIAAGIRRVMGDESVRVALIERGLVRAASYSWEASGAALASAIETTVREAR